jgi:hypothetical protein
MAEVTKETITTQGNNSDSVVNTQVKGQATSFQTVEYLVYFFFGALEILLVFRFILKLMGANIFSAFVGLIYGLTGVFILPFEGIFHQASTQGLVTTAVFEPQTIVAIIVYAVLAIGIVKLIRILSGKQQAA